MKIQQSLNSPTQWMVTRDDNEGYVMGYISLIDGVYQADGPKLHHGKGGMRKRLGAFQTLEEAGKASRHTAIHRKTKSPPKRVSRVPVVTNNTTNL